MRVMRSLLIISLVVFVTLSAGCELKPDAKVIECSNVFFKCSENDCENQCGKIATEKGKVMSSYESVNDGSGCWCEYEDPESKIEKGVVEEEIKESASVFSRF